MRGTRLHRHTERRYATSSGSDIRADYATKIRTNPDANGVAAFVA